MVRPDNYYLNGGGYFRPRGQQDCTFWVICEIGIATFRRQAPGQIFLTITGAYDPHEGIMKNTRWTRKLKNPKRLHRQADTDRPRAETSTT